MRRFFVRVTSNFGLHRAGDDICLDEEAYERAKGKVEVTAVEVDGKIEVDEAKPARAKAKAKD